MTAKKTTKTRANSAKHAPKAKKADKPRRPTLPSVKTSPKKLSALDAAARILQETKQPMTCKELVESMAAKGYWKSPGGKTPHATLYTVVTMLPKWAPRGALIKRARRDPVDNSDLFVFNFDAFHQASNDFAARVPVGSM
jgi:hypothetical protein